MAASLRRPSTAGTYALDNTNPSTDALIQGQVATDAFSYTVGDGHGGVSSSSLTITITGANDAPVANDDFANMVPLLRDPTGPFRELRDAPSLLSNDSDVDAGQSALLRLTQVDGVAVSQTPGIETTVIGVYGTLFVQANGTYRYVLNNLDPDTAALAPGELAQEHFDYIASNGAGAGNQAAATLTVEIEGNGNPDVPIVINDPAPYYAFSLDSKSPNSILADLTDIISSGNGQPLDYSLAFYSPTTAASWSWLDQSAIPILSASPAAITNANTGMYMALVFAGNNGLSAVAFTILGDTASEFDITVDSSGSGPGERGSGNRSIGDLVIVNDNITGSVSAGSGDDVIWIRDGTGTHHLDGGNGNDALYGNAGNDILDAGGGNNFVSGGDGSDELITGGGNDILLGGNGNDHLSSGNGDDVLMGGAGNDVLSAAANNDVLIGGTGNDTLTGGGGADRFVFAEAGVANVDHITDYQAGVPSTIDLSPLLNSNFGSGSNVVDFARLVQNGSDVMVQADLDGTANGVDWQDVVVLDGYGTAGADVVNVYFNNQNHILAA